MIEGRRALDLALDLAQIPTLADAMRAQPLPADTLVVIRIAAGCHDTCKEAARLTRLPADAITTAAVHYVQQVLFSPESDYHRVLGVSPSASKSQKREHFRWLMTWLHPDKNQSEWESIFAARVIEAWREVGQRDQAQQDRQNQAARPLASRRRPDRPNRMQSPTRRWIALPILPSRADHRLRKRRIITFVLVGLLSLAVSSIPVVAPAFKWFDVVSADTAAPAKSAE